MSDITFDYEIENLGVHLQFEGKTNVVYEIRALLVGTKENITEQYGKALIHHKEFFVVHIPTNDLTNFIEYENLDRQKIIEWIEKYGSNNLENYKNTLTSKFYPTKKYLKPPFENTL